VDAGAMLRARVAAAREGRHRRDEVGGSSAIGCGAQRRRLGEHSTSRQGAVRHRPSPMRRNDECIAEGRRRYSHERRLCVRGAVKADPESCSA